MTQVTAFSPDGKWEVRTSPETNEVHIVDRVSGTPLVTFRHREPVLEARFSADGNRVLVIGASLARLYDARSGVGVGAPIRLASPVRAVAMNSDASRIVLLNENQSVSVWEVATGRQLLRVVTAGSGMERVEKTITIGHPVQIIAINDRGDRIAVSEDGYNYPVHSINIDSGDHVEFLPAAARVASISFDPSGRWIATGASSTFARVWDAETGKPISPALKHPTFVRGVAFSPDGSQLVTTDSHAVARVWDWRTGDRLASHNLLGGNHVRNIWFSTDGKRLVFVDSHGAATQWTLPSFNLDERYVDALLALLTGRHIDATGGIEILPAETFREDPDHYLEAWRKWRGVGGSAGN